ncbi:MAG: hypothetical protein LUG66_08790 [Clostridiales bacterium]|nr:hypothetical protein [Clostridiales bacterium]
MSKINEAVFKIIVFMNVIPVIGILLVLGSILIYEFGYIDLGVLETVEMIFDLLIIYCFFGFHIIDTTALIIYYLYNLKNFKIEEYIITYSLVFLISIVIDFIMTCLVYILPHMIG